LSSADTNTCWNIKEGKAKPLNAYVPTNYKTISVNLIVFQFIYSLKNIFSV